MRPWARVYTYFPSKGALVAEVQREAVDRLTASYLLLRPVVEERVADLDPVVGRAAPTWWASPASRSTASTSSRRSSACSSSSLAAADDLVPTEEGARVLPAVFRLLDLAASASRSPTEVGALRPADAMDRTIVLAAALNGVVQVGQARPLGSGSPRRRPVRAGCLVDDLFIGFGAEAWALGGGPRRDRRHRPPAAARSPATAWPVPSISGDARS